MRTLEIPNLPDELVEQIEKLARLRGISISEQAAEFLAKGVAADDVAEQLLLAEIRLEREELARRGVRITDDEITQAKNWGRE